MSYMRCKACMGRSHACMDMGCTRPVYGREDGEGREGASQCVHGLSLFGHNSESFQLFLWRVNCLASY
eukprot:359793-Chlamydomonas_euryale.AAC.8